MKKTFAYKIKVIVLSLLLLVESIVLTHALVSYALSGNLTPELFVFIKIALLMLLISYTHTLTVGAWGDWEQYVVAPLPITLGILITLSTVDPVHARNVSLLSALLLLYFTLRSISLGSLFVLFSARRVMRKAIGGTLFVFSLVCASVVFINADGSQLMNIEDNITDTIVEKVQDLGPQDMRTGSLLNKVSGTLDVERQIRKEVENALEPYRGALAPVVALLVFSMIQATGTVTLLIYSLSIDGVFWLVKRAKLIKIEHMTVQQEKPTF